MYHKLYGHQKYTVKPVFPQLKLRETRQLISSHSAKELFVILTSNAAVLMSNIIFTVDILNLSWKKILYQQNMVKMYFLYCINSTDLIYVLLSLRTILFFYYQTYVWHWQLIHKNQSASIFQLPNPYIQERKR